MSIKGRLCTIQINKGGRKMAEIDDYLQPRAAITENVDLQHIQEVGFAHSVGNNYW